MKILRTIIDGLKRKLSHRLIQLITRKARRNERGRVCRSCFSCLWMLSPTKRIPHTFHGARHAPWHHRGPLMPSPIKAKCSGKKKRSEKEAWGRTGKERRTEGEPRTLERISRGKEFRTMLQLMRIKLRWIYHAAADTPCCLFDFAPLPARDGSTGFTRGRP